LPNELNKEGFNNLFGKYKEGTVEKNA